MGGGGQAVVCTENENKGLLPNFKIEGGGGWMVVIFWNSLRGRVKHFQTTSGGGLYMFEAAVCGG